MDEPPLECIPLALRSPWSALFTKLNTLLREHYKDLLDMNVALTLDDICMSLRSWCTDIQYAVGDTMTTIITPDIGKLLAQYLDDALESLSDIEYSIRASQAQERSKREYDTTERIALLVNTLKTAVDCIYDLTDMLIDDPRAEHSLASEDEKPEKYSHLSVDCKAKQYGYLSVEDTPKEQRELERQTNASRLTIRYLRVLIRERYRLDLSIWSQRDVLEADRKIIMKDCEKADSTLNKIYFIVEKWEPDLFDSAEWSIAKEIKSRLSEKQRRPIWCERPPWDPRYEEKSVAGSVWSQF